MEEAKKRPAGKTQEQLDEEAAQRVKEGSDFGLDTLSLDEQIQVLVKLGCNKEVLEKVRFGDWAKMMGIREADVLKHAFDNVSKNGGAVELPFELLYKTHVKRLLVGKDFSKAVLENGLLPFVKEGEAGSEVFKIWVREEDIVGLSMRMAKEVKDGSLAEAKRIINSVLSPKNNFDHTTSRQDGKAQLKALKEVKTELKKAKKHAKTLAILQTWSDKRLEAALEIVESASPYIELKANKRGEQALKKLRDPKIILAEFGNEVKDMNWLERVISHMFAGHASAHMKRLENSA